VRADRLAVAAALRTRDPERCADLGLEAIRRTLGQRSDDRLGTARGLDQLMRHPSASPWRRSSSRSRRRRSSRWRRRHGDGVADQAVDDSAVATRMPSREAQLQLCRDASRLASWAGFIGS
jgi:hypothetical protein